MNVTPRAADQNLHGLTAVELHHIYDRPFRTHTLHTTTHALHCPHHATRTHATIDHTPPHSAPPQPNNLRFPTVLVQILVVVAERAVPRLPPATTVILVNGTLLHYPDTCVVRHPGLAMTLTGQTNVRFLRFRC